MGLEFEAGLEIALKNVRCKENVWRNTWQLFCIPILKEFKLSYIFSLANVSHFLFFFYTYFKLVALQNYVVFFFSLCPWENEIATSQEFVLGSNSPRNRALFYWLKKKNNNLKDVNCFSFQLCKSWCLWKVLFKSVGNVDVLWERAVRAPCLLEKQNIGACGCFVLAGGVEIQEKSEKKKNQKVCNAMLCYAKKGRRSQMFKESWKAIRDSSGRHSHKQSTCWALGLRDQWERGAKRNEREKK